MLNTLISRKQIRSNFVQDDHAAYEIPMSHWRRTSDLTALPAAGDGTNLGLDAGTHGSIPPMLVSSVADNNIKTEKARYEFALPVEYVAGQTATFRIRGRILTAAAVDQTIDLEAYKVSADGTVGSDICDTGGQTFISSFADYDFAITPPGLVAGDKLDLEITCVIDDTGAAAGAQAAMFTRSTLLLDIKG